MAERPEDLNLPNSVVTRIIKDALPEGVNVSKDARLAISKAASVFVLYATSCANNFAIQGKRKTISGNDVLNAMTEMEFERFVMPLKKCLEAYKNQQKGKKDAAEQRKKSKEATAEGITVEDAAAEDVVEVSDSDDDAAGPEEEEDGEGEEEGGERNDDDENPDN